METRNKALAKTKPGRSATSTVPSFRSIRTLPYRKIVQGATKVGCKQIAKDCKRSKPQVSKLKIGGLVYSQKTCPKISATTGKKTAHIKSTAPNAYVSSFKEVRTVYPGKTQARTAVSTKGLDAALKVNSVMSRPSTLQSNPILDSSWKEANKLLTENTDNDTAKYLKSSKPTVSGLQSAHAIPPRKTQQSKTRKDLEPIASPGLASRSSRNVSRPGSSPATGQGKSSTVSLTKLTSGNAKTSSFKKYVPPSRVSALVKGQRSTNENLSKVSLQNPQTLSSGKTLNGIGKTATASEISRKPKGVNVRKQPIQNTKPLSSSKIAAHGEKVGISAGTNPPKLTSHGIKPLSSCVTPKCKAEIKGGKPGNSVRSNPPKLTSQKTRPVSSVKITSNAASQGKIRPNSSRFMGGNQKSKLTTQSTKSASPGKRSTRKANTDTKEITTRNFVDKNPIKVVSHNRRVTTRATDSILPRQICAIQPHEIDSKRKYLKSEVMQIAAVSGIVGAVPVPGLDILVDFGLLLSQLKKYLQEFCLDDDFLQKLSVDTGATLEYYQKAFTSALGVLLTKKTLPDALKVYVMRKASQALSRRLTKYIPLVGSVINAAANAYATYEYLVEMIDDLASDADQVHTAYCKLIRE